MIFDIERFEKECFINNVDNFILNSNAPDILEIKNWISRKMYKTTDASYGQSIFYSFKNKILHQIFDVLIEYPECDNFWINSKGDVFNHLGPIGSYETLKINKEGLKSFMRDHKLNQIIQI